MWTWTGGLDLAFKAGTFASRLLRCLPSLSRLLLGNMDGRNAASAALLTAVNELANEHFRPL